MASQAGKGGGPSGKGMASGITGLLLLGGVAFVGQNALFNVDGGHRAIKYTRLGGVSKEIYSEGKRLIRGSREGQGTVINLLLNRNTSQNSLVRDTNRLRCPRETTQRCLLDRNKGFANGQHYMSCVV